MNDQKEFEQEVFEYLDNLRESAVTNIFEADSYIQEEFGVARREARELLGKWMIGKWMTNYGKGEE